MTANPKLRIVFFGTPAFAEASLRALHENGFNIVAVVTAPDKPAGRGYHVQASAVKLCAQELGLPVLQPLRLKSPEFLEELRSYRADLQIVIAFRMLPELVWNMPPLGTFNLHASYLPYYRGAAPIQRAVMNGETETGVTTFFLKHEIDTGSIILQKKIPVLPEDNGGSLHDKLMTEGAALVIESVRLIESGDYRLTPQAEGHFPHAPKIFTEDCAIDWKRKAAEIHNQIRGLSPYPAAFTHYQEKKLKIYSSSLSDEPSSEPGRMEIRGKDRLLAHCGDFLLQVEEVQPEGKKRMKTRDFINGLHLNP